MIALAAAVGAVAGTLMGLLGGGGAILLVPILVYGFALDPHSATTASLVIVASGAVAGVTAHARQHNVQWRNGAIFGLVGSPATWVGSQAAAIADPNLLLLAFSLLTAAIAGLMLHRRTTEQTMLRSPQKISKITAAALCVGILTGLFGVGGGFIIVPALVLLLGFPMRWATGTSLLVILINSVGALASRTTFILTLDWALVGSFASMAVLGNVLGSRLAQKIETERLRAWFAALLLTVAASVALQATIALVDSH